MAQILVRNLDPKLVKRLKEQAEENRRSLQAEARVIIENGTRSESRAALLKRMARMRKLFEGRPQSDSGDIQHEMRQER